MTSAHRPPTPPQVSMSLTAYSASSNRAAIARVLQRLQGVA